MVESFWVVLNSLDEFECQVWIFVDSETLLSSRETNVNSLLSVFRFCSSLKALWIIVDSKNKVLKGHTNSKKCKFKRWSFPDWFRISCRTFVWCKDSVTSSSATSVVQSWSESSTLPHTCCCCYSNMAASSIIWLNTLAMSTSLHVSSKSFIWCSEKRDEISW